MYQHYSVVRNNKKKYRNVIVFCYLLLQCSINVAKAVKENTVQCNAKGPDWSFCRVDSGPWALFLTPMVYNNKSYSIFT